MIYKKAYKLLYKKVSDILAQYDPYGLIKDGSPADEYDGETSEILPLLKSCRNENDATEIIAKVFADSFGGNDEAHKEYYKPVASKIWEEYKTYIKNNER